MDGYRINMNYAKALLLLAQDLGQADAVMADMQLAHTVCVENHQLSVILNNPTLPERKKAAIVTELFQGKVTSTTLAFLSFVVKKRRSIHLKGIAEAYMELYRDSRNIVRTDVVTAVPVQPDLLETLRHMVQDYTHKQVDLVNTVSNRMLGGFCMTFNNNMYDARLRTKVAKLRNEFSKNTYEKQL